jgi:hypothetical protein
METHEARAGTISLLSIDGTFSYTIVPEPGYSATQPLVQGPNQFTDSRTVAGNSYSLDFSETLSADGAAANLLLSGSGSETQNVGVFSDSLIRSLITLEAHEKVSIYAKLEVSGSGFSMAPSSASFYAQNIMKIGDQPSVGPIYYASASNPGLFPISYSSTVLIGEVENFAGSFEVSATIQFGAGIRISNSSSSANVGISNAQASIIAVFVPEPPAWMLGMIVCAAGFRVRGSGFSRRRQPASHKRQRVEDAV